MAYRLARAATYPARVAGHVAARCVRIWEAWPASLTRVLLTCSSLYCAFVAWEHERDVAQLKRKVTDLRGMADSTTATVKPVFLTAIAAGREAAEALKNATETHTIPAAKAFAAAAGPRAARGARAAVGVAAAAAACAIDGCEAARDDLERRRADRERRKRAADPARVADRRAELRALRDEAAAELAALDEVDDGRAAPPRDRNPLEMARDALLKLRRRNATAAANETAVEEPEAPEPEAEAEEIGASATRRGEIEVYAC